jgi:holliday junction DNA helicase RuvA
VIASVEGRVSGKTRDALIVAVGGVGLRIVCPQTLLATARPGETLFLHTHLIVRDDDLSLVGFSNEDELVLFRLLLGVTGVGPKLAVGLISAMSPDALRRAVGQDQPELIARVPGIGKKTAQKIVLELKDRIGAVAPDTGIPGLALLVEADAAVVDALTALGYSVVEAQRAVQSLPRDVTDVEARLRMALGSFAG